jgi:hyperosmotically inducible protein
MFKRMSVVCCGLALVMMTAGVASAQTATEKTKTAVKKADEKTEQAAKKTGEATKKAAKKTAAVLTDAEITTAVKTKFLADTKVSGLDVHVETTNHVVTLTGAVKSAAEKAEAYRVAKKTAGVHQVVNKLTVEPKKK